jgi:prepilin-type processing-associated H-X9-DG protein
MEKRKFKLTWVEISVTAVALILLTVLLLPFIRGPQRKMRCTTCTSILRQLAMAATMYADDHTKRVPGLLNEKSKKYEGWVRQLLPYVRGGTDYSIPGGMFVCTSLDGTPAIDDYPVTYAYNAALLMPDGMGIKQKDIMRPEKTGMLCDSEILQIDKYQGGIIGFNNKGNTNLIVNPLGRHEGYVVVGYADGHAGAVEGKYIYNDKENGVNKAFYRAVELGYIKKDLKGK